MTAKPDDIIRACDAAGVWVTVSIAQISCVYPDDDQTDATLLTLLDESVVMLPENYEDVMDWMATRWPTFSK